MTIPVSTGAPLAFELLFQSAQGIFHAYKSQTTANNLPMWKAQASHVITALSHGVDAMSSTPTHLQLLLGDVSHLQAQLISTVNNVPLAPPPTSQPQPPILLQNPFPHPTPPQPLPTHPTRPRPHVVRPPTLFSRPPQIFSNPKPHTTTRTIHPLPPKPILTTATPPLIHTNNPTPQPTPDAN